MTDDENPVPRALVAAPMSEQSLRELYDAAFDPDSEFGENYDYDAALAALQDAAIESLPQLLDIVDMARAALLVVSDDAASAEALSRLRVSIRRLETMPDE